MSDTKTSGRPSPKYLSKLATMMRHTRAGECAIEHITRNNVPVHFYRSDDTSVGGWYRPSQKLICIKRNPGYEAQVLIHEARHSRQHLAFPELFPGIERGGIDYYVSCKLVEFDAKFAEQEHQLPVLVAQAAIRRGDIPDLPKAKYKWAAAECGRNHKLQKLFTPEPQEQINYTLKHMMNWAFHERHIFNNAPNILAVIASGEFEERVAAAASKFLAPEFLEQFCRDWEGKSYLPTNPQPFFDKLTQCISTIHDPDLATLAKALSESGKAANEQRQREEAARAEIERREEQRVRAQAERHARLQELLQQQAREPHEPFRRPRFSVIENGERREVVVLKR